MKEKVSIIIPVYNAEKYLDECIDSLVKQTYPNIEIVIVDNMSTDDSLKICKKYSHEYKNIKIFHCNKKGVSFARNEGLKLATGKYVSFVDADDYVDVRMCECLVDAIEKNNADISICGIVKEFEGEKKIITNEAFYTDNIWNERFIELYSKYIINIVYNKLYRLDQIKYLFNINYRIAEDLDFALHYLEENPKVSFINEALYTYRYQRPDEIKTKHYNAGRIESVATIMDSFNTFLNNSSMVDDKVKKKAYKLNAEQTLTAFMSVNQIKSFDNIKEIRKHLSILCENPILINVLTKEPLNHALKKTIITLIKKSKVVLLLFILYLYPHIKGA